MNRLEAVIFDVDGTLVDSERDGHRVAFNAAFEEAEALAQQLHPRKTQFMQRLVEDGKVQARPGVRRLIDKLESAGVQLHVATTGTRAWVELLLDHAFGQRFQVVVTGTEVSDLKPSPAAYPASPA